MVAPERICYSAKLPQCRFLDACSGTLQVLNYLCADEFPSPTCNWPTGAWRFVGRNAMPRPIKPGSATYAPSISTLTAINSEMGTIGVMSHA